MSPPVLSQVAHLVNQAVEDNIVPGAVALVAVAGTTVLDHATGHTQLVPKRRPVEPDTIYDLASLTKAVVTATAIMILIDQGKLHLQQRVVDILPEFAAHNKHDVRIVHLLTHTSGLPAHNRVSRTARNPTETVRLALSMYLSHDTGTRELYTDLGYLALGEIVTRLTNKPLNQFAHDEIFHPLAMVDTSFNPREELHWRCAATEDNPARGGIIIGEVHDEKAYLMNGVAGHAGLFSTAPDLMRFGRMILGQGRFEGTRILSTAAAEALIRNQTPHLPSARGLAWALSPNTGFSFDDLAGPRACVHTGFTGTSIYLDPDEDMVAILLTNRVHPSRNNTAYFRLRAHFHNALNAALR